MSKPSHWKAKPTSTEYDKIKGKIVQCAWDLICDKGAASLRLDKVAKQSGCSRSSIYRYFDSKKELLVAVLMKWFFDTTEELTPILDSIENPVDRLVEGIYGPIHAVRTDQYISKMWNSKNNSSSDFAAIALEAIPKVMSVILDPFFELANTKGWLRKDLTSEEAARWILMVIIAMGVFGSGGLTPEQEKDYLRKMIVPSLLNV
jgi:AcrR family transcriptional regulator